MSGLTVPTSLLLSAAILDRLSLMVWFNTKDAQAGRNKPQMLVDALTQKPQTTEQKNAKCFDSVDAFMEALNKLKGA